jgi:hypothetical protein
VVWALAWAWAWAWAWEGVVGGKAGDGWDSGTHMGFRKLGAAVWQFSLAPLRFEWDQQIWTRGRSR